MSKYNPSTIERKWQEKWRESGIYKDYSSNKKFYALDMFPYPSGAGLHVGHPKGYIATDVFARFKMLQGYSVLHPMGWDAFGLPAENYAIENKVHPEVAVRENIKTFKSQLEKFGFTYDWDREINTTDPEYYKWTQWIFLKMFEKGLAYESDEPINWCPSCKTGLALEDLENGLCERCGSQVVQKKMRQWVLKMTDYADRLLFDLDKEKLDWEESIIEQQKNWIGRSEGAVVEFEIKISNSSGNPKSQTCPNCFAKRSRRVPNPKQISNDNDRNPKQFIEVYTTRLDTIFGCTYCVVGPEHPIIEKIKKQIENIKEVEDYIVRAQSKNFLERTDLQKEKTGVELKGIKAINPFNNEEVPVFVADYVIGHYGTGAVMAVPAHDERDFEFAEKHNLSIKHVILKKEFELIDPDNKKMVPWERVDVQGQDWWWKKDYCYTGDGILFESGKYSGMISEKAREEMAKWLEKKKIGGKKVNYKMRDWVFSRQRYWGEPIPIVHCEKCGAVGVPEKDLPVKLPRIEKYEPTGTGEGPLANISEWVNTVCPKCGGTAKRETNTMPQWAGSSWYYLRYINPENDKSLVGKQKEKEWMPVDLYVGGAEHATRHLLYARFWHKFLYDIGVVSGKEPFRRLVHVGLINGEDGRKMSKRWGNVINPDDVIEKFGADSIRLYEMFMGPFTQNIAWSTKGVVGMRRFLEKIWDIYPERVTEDKEKIRGSELSFAVKNENLTDRQKERGRLDIEIINKQLNKTIKKVSEDIENFKFNTAISEMMIFVNTVEEFNISIERFEKFLILLSPFAPHITEEIWRNENMLGHKESIFLEKWPEYDSKLIKDEEKTIIIQINGKIRDQIQVPAGSQEEEMKKLALSREKVIKYVEGKNIRKTVFVRDRLINFVV